MPSSHHCMAEERAGIAIQTHVKWRYRIITGRRHTHQRSAANSRAKRTHIHEPGSGVPCGWSSMAKSTLRRHTTAACAEHSMLEALLGVAALVDATVELRGRWTRSF